MTEKQYCYILEKYSFYEDSDILMVSASCDEITTYFIRESRKLSNKHGLIVTRYEFGKLYDNIEGKAKSIRWIEKKDGKIRDLKGDVE
ncbi:MAG: hypothetical protein KIG63_07780 [Methanobrevibacter sp.]|nr:hypothetical protein [Methanobrevibacter sp.]